jgi:hypothetical protein
MQRLILDGLLPAVAGTLLLLALPKRKNGAPWWAPRLLIASG